MAATVTAAVAATAMGAMMPFVQTMAPCVGKSPGEGPAPPAPPASPAASEAPAAPEPQEIPASPMVSALRRGSTSATLARTWCGGG